MPSKISHHLHIALQMAYQFALVDRLTLKEAAVVDVQQLARGRLRFYSVSGRPNMAKHNDVSVA